MGANADEHTHHPICEACGKEFSDTRELSEHIDREHRAINNDS